jgi:hypothetical protein
VRGWSEAGSHARDAQPAAVAVSSFFVVAYLGVFVPVILIGAAAELFCLRAAGIVCIVAAAVLGLVVMAIAAWLRLRAAR